MKKTGTRGPTPTTVTVSEPERERLDSWAHRSRSAPRLARRARIILACAAGRSTTRIATRRHVSPTTVCKWRTRFLRDRRDGLIDQSRPGTPRRITDTQVEPGGHSDPGDDASRRHALEHSGDGQGDRCESYDDPSHLAGVRIAAASERDL